MTLYEIDDAILRCIHLPDMADDELVDTETGEILVGGDFGGAAADDARSEAISALMSLGYARAEAFKAVSAVGDEGLTSEEYIKKALKALF